MSEMASEAVRIEEELEKVRESLGEIKVLLEDYYDADWEEIRASV